jgi:hypothetical protein
MTARRLKTEVLRAMVEHLKMRDLIAENFAHSDDLQEAVRASEVDTLVAAAMGVDVSTPLRQRVRAAAKAAGYRRTTTSQHVLKYRGMRRCVLGT